MAVVRNGHLPTWLIVVIAVVGGLLVLICSAILLVWRRRRRRTDASTKDEAVQDEDFPPFRRLTVRRGRAVPASWNLSLGASIFGAQNDLRTFSSLDDDGLTGGRRNKGRPRIGRQTTNSSQRSRSQMFEISRTASPAILNSTRGNDYQFRDVMDEAFLERGLSSLPGTGLARVKTGETTYTLPTIINGRELAGQTETHDSVDPLSEENHRVPEQPRNKHSLPDSATPQLVNSRTKSETANNSLPRSRYSKLERSKSSQSILSNRFSSAQSLPAVIEDDTPRRPVTAGAVASSSILDSDSNSPHKPLPKWPLIQQQPASAEPGPAPPLKRYQSLRRYLRPIAVPPPVLSTAPSSPAASSRSRRKPHTPSPVSPSKRVSTARTSISDISSTFTVVQATPAMRVTGLVDPTITSRSLEQPPLPALPQPQDQQQQQPPKLTPVAAAPTTMRFSELLLPPRPAFASSRSSHNSNGSLPSPTSTFTTTITASGDGASSPISSPSVSSHLQRTPSKKGNVLRKKSIRRQQELLTTSIS